MRILGAADTHTYGSHVSVLPEQEVAPASRLCVHSLSVVLPAYNEEALIERTVKNVLAALVRWTLDFEVIVVNDGSKDRTGEIVEGLMRSDPRIRLITHPVNEGYGAALVSGFRAVDKELVFFMDSDGQFDINDLALFFPLIEQYDAVLGYRNPRVDHRVRKFNAWGWKQLAHLCLGVCVRDLDCAFKLYHAKFFQTLSLETRGAMINAEIMYKFKREGYSFTEVGVHHLPREEGEATGARPAVILRALREMIIFAYKWKKTQTSKS
jgi:glycosyltransferase involved in cell wall biosynthesis